MFWFTWDFVFDQSEFLRFGLREISCFELHEILCFDQNDILRFMVYILEISCFGLHAISCLGVFKKVLTTPATLMRLGRTENLVFSSICI